MISNEDLKVFLKAQQNELTESLVYKKLASIEKIEDNKKVLLKLSADEVKHAEILKKYTQQTVKPKKWKVLRIFCLLDY